MKIIIAIAAIVLTSAALSACAMGPLVAVMQNPKTGEVAQCRHDPLFVGFADVNACIDGYKKAGWVILTPDKDTP